MHLPVDSKIPVFGFVGRLSHQKGVDLILEALSHMENIDAQIIIQGIGEKRFYDELKERQRRFPHKIALRFEFNEELAHRIYAGADMFLMPSAYEPCGLSQMISLRYGTIPFVYKTGGLVDTVKPFDSKALKGHGFIFEKYTREDFLQCFQEAVQIFHKKDLFDRLIHNAFSLDFSWQKSAQGYERVYECVLSA